MAAAEPAAELYRKHCANCHGADRFGRIGPALLPENLARLPRDAAATQIRDSRPGVQMPPFKEVLNAQQIDALADYIYTPVTPAPHWSEAEIRDSRIVQHAPGTLPDKPQFAADPLNLFVVIEAGNNHVAIVDGDRFERIHRFPSRFALHGVPKFTPDGRYVFFASRDGWVTKFDLWNLAVVTEVRAGINGRNLAVSDDGRYVLVANSLPHTLVLFDAELNLLNVLATSDRDGRQSSRVSAVYTAEPRRSFVAVMKDVKEVWELSYDPQAPGVPVGVGSPRDREGVVVPGLLNPRRSFPNDFLNDVFFTPDYSRIVGASREGGGQVVDLDGRRSIVRLDLPGMPHFGSGITWNWQGRPIVAIPNQKEGLVSIIDMGDWKTIRQVKTLGPGLIIRTHENTRYAWVDAMLSPEHKDTLQLIDKQTLEIAAQLKPAPGKTLTHVEFTRDGRYGVASLVEDDGAIIVFDATTLKEIRRLPASKPIGKANVWNKITRAEGTSR